MDCFRTEEGKVCGWSPQGLEMRRLNLWYGFQNYQSHARAARDYISILQQHCQLVRMIDAAEIVILHYEPHDYLRIYGRIPDLKTKYVISYCVWEASVLPDSYVRSLSLVDEIWTCSQYCLSILKHYHPVVTYMPHVVERDSTVTNDDISFVKQLIDFKGDSTYYLTIGRLWDKRKNIEGLINIFRSLQGEMPSARLIIKCAPNDIIPTINDSSVIYIPMSLSNSQITALYKLVDVYVSPHHAEGWGFAISDAMLLGRTVIATRYSGNLDYMTDDNSFLIPCEERSIEKEDCYGLFDERMQWAYPNQGALRSLLRGVYNESARSIYAPRIGAAKIDVQRFDRYFVNKLIKKRIDEISMLL